MFNYIDVDLPELSRVTEDNNRLYVTPDGKKYPSVTTITSLYSREFIQAWKERVGEKEAARVSRISAGRGTRMHKLCEDYLKNAELEKTMPDAQVMFNSIKPILDKYVDNVHSLEAPLYSHHLKSAGTVDCIAEFDGKLSIIDFKTSKRKKTEDKIPNYFMQCAAYAVMYEEMTGTPINRLVIIMAVENEEPLVFVKKRDDYIKGFLDLRLQYKKETGL